MKTICFALLMAGCCAGLRAQGAPEAGSSRHMERRFDPSRAQSFDNPERDAWQKPGEVLAVLDLKNGQAVADIGAGTGYFTVRLAKQAAAPTVFAVDIEASMLDHIRQRAEKEGLKNVRTVQGSATSANLPEKVDCVLMVNTYHHIADRVAYFRDLRKSLKPGGRVAIIDWKKGGAMGPRHEHRFTAAEITQELEGAGYERAGRHDVLPNQEFLIFRAAPGAQ